MTGKYFAQRPIRRTMMPPNQACWALLSSSPAPGVRLYSISKDAVSDGLDTKELREYNQACGQFSRLLPERQGDILSVDVIVYDDGVAPLSHFLAKKNEFIESGIPDMEMWVFHGSSSEGINGIVREGFKVGGRDVPLASKRMSFGMGVYSAIGPATPIGYSGASKTVRVAM